MENESIVKMIINIPEELRRHYKIKAAYLSKKNDRVTINDLVIKALESDYKKSKLADTLTLEGYKDQPTKLEKK